MGHRASIGYVRRDGTVQAHYSHWGALDARILNQPPTPEQPYGESADEVTEEQLRQSLECEEAAEWDYEMDRGDAIGDIESHPYGTYESLSEWAREGVTFLHHECAYVVDTRDTPFYTDMPTDGWSVMAYDTLWHKGPPGEPGGWSNIGILVRLRDGDEWGDFAHGTDDDAPPDYTLEQDEWLTEALEWLGEDIQRVPPFSPLPEDNRA